MVLCCHRNIWFKAGERDINKLFWNLNFLIQAGIFSSTFLGWVFSNPTHFFFQIVFLRYHRFFFFLSFAWFLFLECITFVVNCHTLKRFFPDWVPLNHALLHLFVFYSLGFRILLTNQRKLCRQIEMERLIDKIIRYFDSSTSCIQLNVYIAKESKFKIIVCIQ